MELHCGNMHMQYENGFLRYISAGNIEILRMVYISIRDKNWNTIEGRIVDEKINVRQDGFSISYVMLFEKDDLHIQFDAEIKGNAENAIFFEIKGRALSSFKKNRIGFCVLHPIQECRAKEVVITHSNNSKTKNLFPFYVSPHQPFKDIKAMQWQPANHCSAALEFTGDVFETEDHRNWTDNNYKTYCTPLELPFPVTLNAGGEVHQTITLRTTLTETVAIDEAINVIITDETFPIPNIGVGAATEMNKNYFKALAYLSEIGFSHYRVYIKLSNNNWKQVFSDALQASAIIKAPLEIAVFITEENYAALHELAAIIQQKKSVKQIIVLQENAKCINNNLLQQAMNILSVLKEQVLIGAGTDVYFAELNRSNLDTNCIDFINYSVNPQVHAFDEASIIENMEGQFYAAESALHKFNKNVHVSPVTLKMRYNADATDAATTSLPLSDERQPTDFCAGFTLGSIKYLAEARAASITYFETTGSRGLIDTDTLQPFPALEVFKLILDKKWKRIRKCICTQPLVCTAIILENDNERILLAANHTNAGINIHAGDTVFVIDKMQLIKQTIL